MLLIAYHDPITQTATQLENQWLRVPLSITPFDVPASFHTLTTPAQRTMRRHSNADGAQISAYALAVKARLPL